MVPARLEEVKSAMFELVAATLKEAGCIRYELHRDNQQSNRFMFVETWQSREHWRAHMRAEAIAAFNQKIAGAIEDFELFEMTELS